MTSKVIGLGALLLRAKNVALLADWYHMVLGFEMDLSRDGGRYGSLKTHSGRIELAITQRPASMPPGAPVVALTWRVSDLDAHLKQLAALGIAVRAELTDESGRFVFVRDPEGNEVALWGEAE